jgi:hypothetical protein
MKHLVIGIILLSLCSGTYSQNNPKYIPLGKVACLSKQEYLDSSRNAYGIYHEDENIQQSPYLIDISMFQSGFPHMVLTSARLFWDSCFKLVYFKYSLQDNDHYAKSDTLYPPGDINLDSLFSQLIKNGLFSLPLVSTSQLKNNWNADYISPKGEFGAIRSSGVADGNEYVLTIKVKNCYRQYIFDNPDTYAKLYVDHAIFKQQDSIVKTLMSGYK